MSTLATGITSIGAIEVVDTFPDTGNNHLDIAKFIIQAVIGLTALIKLILENKKSKTIQNGDK